MSRRAGCLAVVSAALLSLAVLLVVPEPALRPERPWASGAGLSTGFLDMGGWRTRYVAGGAGPPVVLLHGFASSVYTWKDVMPALARAHTVVALDFPGFGDSSIPRPLDASAYPGHVLAVMDRLGIARASLVGNSLGGAVAFAVAADHPGRVERLVLIDSAGFNLEQAERPWLLRMAGNPAAASALERLPVRRRLAAAGLRQVFHDDALVTEERIDAYTRPLLRPGAMAAAAELLQGRIATDVPGQLRRVRAPTLVVWGAEDGWIPVSHAQRFADAIAGAEVAILEECGHVPQEEKPAEVAALLARFLAAPVIRPGAD